MVDEPKNSTGPAKADDEDARRPRAGQRLAEARRSRDISIGEIAKELHLDEPKVQALEENQFDILGAPVFAKGHLRKYAELVGVPIEDVLTDYYQLNRSAGAPPVVGRKRSEPRDVKFGPWIAAVIAVAVLAAGIYWFLNREQGAEVVRTPGVLEPYAEQVEDTSQAVAEPVQEPVAESQLDEESEEIASGTSDAVTVEPQAQESTPPPAAAPGQITLAMQFSGDCWTEVTDADGNRMYFGMGQAGQTITRAGTPPLQALFGDRENVSVTVNGSDFPLSSGIRRGNTTRVTIDQ